MQAKQVKISKPKKVPVPQYISQKNVRNDCLQALDIHFVNELGAVENYWLAPQETIKIPSNGVTPQLKLLQERRMIKIRDV